MNIILAEFLKLKRSPICFVIVALLLLAPSFIYFRFKPDLKGIDYTYIIIYQNFKMFVFNILPLIVILLISFLMRIEQMSDSYKMLFIQPVNAYKFYLGKITFILLIILISLLIFVGFINLSAFALNIKHTNLNINFLLLNSYCARLILHSFISILGLVMFIFLINLLIKNIIINISANILCVFVFTNRLILVQQWSSFIPYSQSSKNIMFYKTNSSAMLTCEILSIAYFIIFAVISYFYFTRRLKKVNVNDE